MFDYLFEILASAALVVLFFFWMPWVLRTRGVLDGCWLVGYVKGKGLSTLGPLGYAARAAVIFP